MKNIDRHHSKEDGSSIENVEVPLGGDDRTVPTVCEFDSSVNRPRHGHISAAMGARKRHTNLITTMNVEIPIPMRRSLIGGGTAA